MQDDHSQTVGLKTNNQRKKKTKNIRSYNINIKIYMTNNTNIKRITSKT